MHGDAATIAALFAVDPSGLGGVVLRGPACKAREDWLAFLRGLLPPKSPVRRVPLNTGDTALLGGLDLAASLQAGRPVAVQGLMAQADGGVLLLAMAERMTANTAARFGSVLDSGFVSLQREGLDHRVPVRLGLVALDESASDDEQVPASLAERLAFRWALENHGDAEEGLVWSADEVQAARQRLARVHLPDESVQALCAAAIALGIDSARPCLFAARAARAAAALAGCDTVQEEHVAVAARLVLAPLATRLPDAPPEQEDDSDRAPPQDPSDQQKRPPEKDPAQDSSASEEQTQDTQDPHTDLPDVGELVELVLQAARAALPNGLLERLRAGAAQRLQSIRSGASGAEQKNASRGRPIGARKGEPRAGQRINVLETLRAAAPWQPLRKRSFTAGKAPSVVVYKEDFHVTRFRQLGQTTTVFVVDASGSAALNRLAEAKGAVELLLADCYVRRDSVAVLAFRGVSAEILLPPTRSLSRAKRSLAGLPGGGGTPLAIAIDAAVGLAAQIRRRGETPIVVFLTDGKANIARDGRPGRGPASADALAAALRLRLDGVRAMLVDTSPQPQESARALSGAMGAHYTALPYAGAQVLNQAVRALVGRS
jgi:magnesium chelatase subunit D